MLATGSFDASVGIWQHVDVDEYTQARLDTTDAEVQAFAAGQPASNGGTSNEADEEDADADEWRFAIVLDGHESEVKSVAWSAGGNLLATCSRDKSVWIWEEIAEDEYETVAVLGEHEGDVKCVSWHPEEELVASGSYDDCVRLWRDEVDDWGCVGLVRGHGGTVWCVQWEGVGLRVGGVEVAGGDEGEGDGVEAERKKWIQRRRAAGPRLMSCSDDLTIRVWRRVPRERVVQRPMSILRTGSNEETWVEEARLPMVHSRPIYAVAWSGRSGRVASTGGDGVVVVYEEVWDEVPAGKESTREASNSDVVMDGAEGGHAANGTDGQETQDAPRNGDGQGERQATRWKIIAQIEGAHGVFEINHVAWARKPKGKENSGGTEEEELIVTTGDDGSVKVWELKV